ncbi:MAG: ChrR family anti-sigma-E factor [Pseudomonadota bacterium]
MPTYNPSTELLADYAAGAASPGTSLLIATHLTQAPESRAKVSELEAVGGAVLSQEPAAEMRPDALDKALAMLDAPCDADASEPATNGESPLPRPVMEALGLTFSEIPWKFRLPGVSEYEFDGFGEEKVSILRARPGAALPQHTHKGCEMTLVMTGALQDGEEVYRAGDLAVNDEDDDHRPQIVGEEICHCLVVMNGSLHFTGTFSRALNFLGE